MQRLSSVICMQRMLFGLQLSVGQSMLRVLRSDMGSALPRGLGPTVLTGLQAGNGVCAQQTRKQYT